MKTARPQAANPSQSEVGLEYVPCNLCGAAAATIVIRANTQAADLRAAAFACTSPTVGQHGTIVRCDRCGLIYTNPRPNAAMLDGLYAAVEDPAYLEDEEARLATFRYEVRRLAEHAPCGGLLDIGAHVGTFLRVARDAGYAVSGVEPSAWAARYARETHDLDVRPTTVANAGFTLESFDLITMWDVVEHFADPQSELREVARFVKPGGVFALTTMNVASFAPRILRGRWPWYMLMHQYYFTPETMSRMLENAGFKVIAVEPHRRIVYVHYLVSKLHAYSPFLHSLARGFTERTGLGGLRIPVNLGDLMTIYARKV
ncbi:MAG: class I SAM-dependent methyltransferase [Chloroflexota bacterium]|nr:class I SAM-dependent methyltransferase [Chloroflexota bacterium]